MANNIVRARGTQTWSPPAVGTRDGNWTWDGSNWVCDPDCNGDGQFPPFGPPVFSGPVNQPPWYPGANGGISFGAVAPPNPVRGHMWWDGTSFWLFDGAAWVAVGGAAAGASLGSSPPANPFPGQTWFNGSTLFVWDGNAWVPTSTTRSFVQATAPPAPNPGDLWFDGSVQRIWNGSAWIAVGPGALVGPVGTTTKVFQLSMAGTTLALGASNVWSIVPFTSTPSIDTEAGWNATTHKYTPTKAGYYAFFTNSWLATAEQSAGHALLQNDNGTWSQNSQSYVTSDIIALNAAPSIGLTLTAAGIVHLNGSTDFVRLWGVSSDGNFDQLSTTMPTITGFLLP
jgi:hypothetical protein